MCESHQLDVKLRPFLLRMLDDLTAVDRCRLHFVLGEDVPRRLRENSNLEDTFLVLEHLIATDKLFSCLADALVACGKSDWATKLRELEEPSVPLIFRLDGSMRSKTTLTQSVLNAISDDEEDTIV